MTSGSASTTETGAEGEFSKHQQELLRLAVWVLTPTKALLSTYQLPFIGHRVNVKSFDISEGNYLQHILMWLFSHDREDSCGFEHVFVGETKKGQEVMGLHNWIQFYLQEKHDHVDYKGYKARDNKDTVRKHCTADVKSQSQALTIQNLSYSPVFEEKIH